MRLTAGLELHEIIDEIYASCTLEDAIFWREEFIARMASLIASSNLFDARSRDEVCLYSGAKAQAEQAVARLQLCLARNERFEWPRSLAARNG